MLCLYVFITNNYDAFKRPITGHTDEFRTSRESTHVILLEMRHLAWGKHIDSPRKTSGGFSEGISIRIPKRAVKVFDQNAPYGHGIHCASENLMNGLGLTVSCL
jgi:hypothetical protein